MNSAMSVVGQTVVCRQHQANGLGRHDLRSDAYSKYNEVQSKDIWEAPSNAALVFCITK